MENIQAIQEITFVFIVTGAMVLFPAILLTYMHFRGPAESKGE